MGWPGDCVWPRWNRRRTGGRDKGRERFVTGHIKNPTKWRRDVRNSSLSFGGINTGTQCGCALPRRLASLCVSSERAVVAVLRKGQLNRHTRRPHETQDRRVLSPRSRRSVDQHTGEDFQGSGPTPTSRSVPPTPPRALRRPLRPADSSPAVRSHLQRRLPSPLAWAPRLTWAVLVRHPFTPRSERIRRRTMRRRRVGTVATQSAPG